ncbi:gibberellin-regulated protein 4-like [Salvia hispanica]|uniref:gibberellin-regulated protein 4-like n=1 Tax=Salvia hispanica TaxID=49212 RepID=UPI0020097694|nr:gibberellin-regulated protein 4-like [Salvia hispanica]
MMSSSKFHCIFLLLCVASYLSVIMASLGGDAKPSVSSVFPTASLDQAVTCPVPQSNCANECDRRCSNTEHLNNCLLFCNKCCEKCLCVPPGTYGNKDCCPCYNDWKTQEGGPKCP